MEENVKLRQIITNIDFQSFFQQKENFGENLTFGCLGNELVGVTLKPPNLPISLSWFPWKPGHMTIPIKFDKLKRGTFTKKQL